MTGPGPAEPEDRWTGATKLCPHPERWTSTDDESTELEVTELIAGFVRALQPDYVIETGAAWGQTSEAIGKAMEANGQGRLDAIELDPDRADYVRTRCAGLPVNVIRDSSMNFDPDRHVGFAFFDSIFHLRVAEFLRYRPWMGAGTIVAFHDTAPGHGWVDGTDLRSHVEIGLQGHARLMTLPTPRGITLAEVL